MRIGEFAVQAGVNVQTIRYYERQKLLPQAARTAAGYRSYTARDVERIGFIRRSQQLGFSLKEITQLIGLHNSIAPASKRTRALPQSRAILAIAREKVQAIEGKIELLKNMRRELSSIVVQLEGLNPNACPVTVASRKGN